MWNYVGLIRSEKRLNRATRVLRELDLEIARFYDKCEISDSIIGLPEWRSDGIANPRSSSAQARGRVAAGISASIETLSPREQALIQT